MTPATKGERIQIRITPEHKEMIDRAAKLTGRNRTDFIVQSAYSAAQSVLLDQTIFQFSDAGWEHFVDRLDHPPEPGDALKSLMQQKPIWDK